MIAILLALACAGAPPPPSGPPTSRGMVLFVEEGGLIVQHDDTLGRLTPGVEHYPHAGLPNAVSPGDAVDLWLTEIPGGRRVDALVVTGGSPLPPAFDPDGHALTGTVVRVDGGTLTLDHAPVPGVMAAMVMPFRVGARASAFAPGDRVTARLLDTPYGYALAAMTKTGTGDATLRDDLPPIEVGGTLPRFDVIVEDGSTLRIGEGQDRPTVVTFLYTRCPDPAFCPALVGRLSALQEQLPPGARIVTISLDPEFDTADVLARYGRGVGADPARWRLGHLAPVALHRLALASGLAVTAKDGRIAHLLRLLVLDGSGRLIERYDDNAWPMDRVVGQLEAGGPLAERTGTLSE